MMAAKKQIDSNIIEGPLCAKLLEIVMHTRQAEVELKCDDCKHGQVAVLCTNCAQCYCKACHKQHLKKFEEKSVHYIIPLNKQSLCSEHNKIHEYYCQKCDQSICSSCILNHSSENDHNISSIEEMATKHRSMSAGECLILATEASHQCYSDESSEVAIEELKLSTGEITSGTVKDIKGGCTVWIKARQTEEAMITDSMDGLQIKGGPFTIEVAPKQDVPYRIVNLSGQMGKPWGIAFGKNDMWAVTDNAKNCVYIFDNQNHLVHKFGEQGSKEGNFNGPCGVAFDNNDHLYVVDFHNHRVQKFQMDGKYIMHFGSKGVDDGDLNGPCGIAIHAHSDDACVYIADFHNKRMSVFGTEGQFLYSFGSDCLEGPHDVTISASNKVLVADHPSHKICIFTLDGNLIYKFGLQGKCQGKINHPLSIATTWNDRILVSDENHCVSIFSEEGQYVCCLDSSYGGAAGQLRFPNGVAFRSSSIYVTDSANQRVQIFKLSIRL